MIKFLKTAAELPIYSPAEGYRYIPATSVKKGSTGLSQQQDQESEVNTPGAENSTQSNSQAPKDTSQVTVGIASSNDSRLLYESFNLAQRYGTEYMDENPLQGEPGTFVFSSTNERLRARQNEQAVKAAAAAAASSKVSESQTASAVSTPLSIVDVRTTVQKGGKIDKSQVTAAAAPLPKPKRRKSKAPVSPISPDNTDGKISKTEVQ